MKKVEIIIHRAIIEMQLQSPIYLMFRTNRQRITKIMRAVGLAKEDTWVFGNEGSATLCYKIEQWWAG